MTGNFSWDTEDRANAGASILTVGEKVAYGPRSGTRKMGRAALSWGLGQVEPSVALFLVQGGKRMEITGEEVDVLAGRKVRLEAVAFPYKDDGADPVWSLPATVISGLDGYDRDMSHGRAILLDDAAKLKALNADLGLHRDHLEELVHQRTRALEEGQQKLRDALAEVKTLRGLVPICSSCKKLRDDSGFWSQFELYVEAHSNAEFTHGICPDCARCLYPDYLLDEEHQRSNATED